MVCAANWNLPGVTEQCHVSVKDFRIPMLITLHWGAGNGDVLAYAAVIRSPICLYTDLTSKLMLILAGLRWSCQTRFANYCSALCSSWLTFFTVCELLPGRKQWVWLGETSLYRPCCVLVSLLGAIPLTTAERMLLLMRGVRVWQNRQTATTKARRKGRGRQSLRHLGTCPQTMASLPSSLRPLPHCRCSPSSHVWPG